MKFGVLLPHFGPKSSHDLLFGLGSRLESLGFSSAWVRDHLGFSGGVSFETKSPHFVDPIITMAAIAATSGLTLGTAALTPFRQPVVLAQMIGSLAYLAEGRLILGLGLGKSHAFQLAGYGNANRVDLFQETVEVIRLASRRDAFFHGRWAHFDNLTLDPAPPTDLELWYCGASMPAIQRAVGYTDGWLPGRCPFPVFDHLLSQLRELATTNNKSMRIGIVPLISIDRTHEAALAKLNVAGLLKAFRDKRAWQPICEFNSSRDLRGAVIAGNADDVINELKALEERGVDVIVLDLRERIEEFDETLDRISHDVLPAFKPS